MVMTPAQRAREHWGGAAKKRRVSQIHILRSSSHELCGEAGDPNSLDFRDLVGSASLVATHQFNFSVDRELFCSYLHKSFSGKVAFYTGDNEPSTKRYTNVHVPIKSRWGTHHLKFMVNEYPDAVEIVIMTANITQIDLLGLTQAVWRSGKLPFGKTELEQGGRFRTDFLDYLALYPLIAKVIELVEKVDFSLVTVELILSVPLDRQKNGRYGYHKLEEVLKRNNLVGASNILAQVSSISGPFGRNSIFTHVLCPLIAGIPYPLDDTTIPQQKEHNYKPFLIFPTSEEIANSHFGYMSGTAVHYRCGGRGMQQHRANVKPYLCKWGTKPDRAKVPPHCKFYLADNNDDFRTLKWVLVTSHNLSKQAWGDPTTDTISSYELGVLIYKDPGSTTLPFALPPTRYTASEQPWLQFYGNIKAHLPTDRWGNSYPH